MGTMIGNRPSRWYGNAYIPVGFSGVGSVANRRRKNYASLSEVWLDTYYSSDPEPPTFHDNALGRGLLLDGKKKVRDLWRKIKSITFSGKATNDLYASEYTVHELVSPQVQLAIPKGPSGNVRPWRNLKDWNGVLREYDSQATSYSYSDQSTQIGVYNLQFGNNSAYYYGDSDTYGGLDRYGQGGKIEAENEILNQYAPFFPVWSVFAKDAWVNVWNSPYGLILNAASYDAFYAKQIFALALGVSDGDLSLSASPHANDFVVKYISMPYEPSYIALTSNASSLPFSLNVVMNNVGIFGNVKIGTGNNRDSEYGDTPYHIIEPFLWHSGDVGEVADMAALNAVDTTYAEENTNVIDGKVRAWVLDSDGLGTPAGFEWDGSSWVLNSAITSAAECSRVAFWQFSGDIISDVISGMESRGLNGFYVSEYYTDISDFITYDLSIDFSNMLLIASKYVPLFLLFTHDIYNYDIMDGFSISEAVYTECMSCEYPSDDLSFLTQELYFLEKNGNTPGFNDLYPTTNTITVWNSEILHLIAGDDASYEINYEEADLGEQFPPAP